MRWSIVTGGGLRGRHDSQNPQRSLKAAHQLIILRWQLACLTDALIVASQCTTDKPELCRQQARPAGTPTGWTTAAWHTSGTGTRLAYVTTAAASSAAADSFATTAAAAEFATCSRTGKLAFIVANKPKAPAKAKSIIIIIIFIAMDTIVITVVPLVIITH